MNDEFENNVSPAENDIQKSDHSLPDENKAEPMYSETTDATVSDLDLEIAKTDEAEILQEESEKPTYVWQQDDFQDSNEHAVSRPVYSEKLLETKKNKKHGSFLRYTAAVLAGMFIGAFIFGAGLKFADYKDGKVGPIAQNSKANGKATTVDTLADGSLSVVDIAKKAGPTVVGVINRQKVTTFFGTESEQEGGGSGIIISSDGYIITNAHVVENSNNLSVILSAGSKEYPAKLKGIDEKTDLAVIKIDEKNLPVAEIGKSSELNVGELAVAIGNPMGQEFAGSVTVGVVSALNRSVNVQGRQYNLIQTDAAINPGNSGGALLNKYGQVVGINSVKISANGYEGMGFAIPIDEAMPIINELMTGDGYIKGRPVIGISPREITEQMSKIYDLPQGIYVTEVAQFSAAEKAGIKIGDVIVRADGKPTLTVDELNKIRDTHKAGDKMSLEVVRDGKTINVDLTLGEEKPTNMPEGFNGNN